MSAIGYVSLFPCRFNRHSAIFFIVCLFLSLFTTSCQPMRDAGFRAHYKDANQLAFASAGNQDALFLKVHKSNGDVYIFGNQWVIDADNEVVAGSGIQYDFNRRKISEGEQMIPFDSIILFETNKIPKNNEKDRLVGLSLLAAADVLLGTICLTIPKACFGSCPTFYLDAFTDAHHADAEGFSNAIAPGLEYRDIDALNNPGINDGRFLLTMKNEAFETHNLRSLSILAYPRTEGQRVYHTPEDRFFLCQEAIPPVLALTEEGDISLLLAKNDQQERFSLADPDNMVSKEEILLQFDKNDFMDDAFSGTLGLVAGFRQTLMTTYLIYHALDCMGNQVGDFLARLSSDYDMESSIGAGIKKELGDIDVYVWDESAGSWLFQGGWHETGPIAINHQLITLGNFEPGEDIKIKLIMNRGLWRLDYLHLTKVLSEVDPQVLEPVSLTANIPAEGLLNNLLDPERHLVSMPGNVFTFAYDLPEKDSDYEIFLASEGFYLIWSREQWTREKDLLSLYGMRRNPGRFLQRHASDYKRYESMMEEAFWNSRVNHQIITSHEN